MSTAMAISFMSTAKRVSAEIKYTKQVSKQEAN
jgi:hypothetical protein